MKKRILSVLLVIVMLVCSMPMEENVLDLFDIEASAVAYSWPVDASVDCSFSNFPNYTSSGNFHGGSDFPVGIGSNVYAVAAGTVMSKSVDTGCNGSDRSDRNPGTPACTKAGCKGSYGNYIYIDHGNNVYTLYAHLQTGSFKVKVGDRVEQGQLIASSGAAGNVTGAHLHFEIMVGACVHNSTYCKYPKDYLTRVNVTPSGGGSGGGSSASHTRDTNYGTNFSATANARIDVVNANHSDPGNYYIDPGDICTIHEVYTDGCCMVTYPSSASPTGTRTYYAPINMFSFNTNQEDPIIELVYWGDNGTKTHLRPVVQIKNPETVDHVSFPMWSHNGDDVRYNEYWYDSVFNGGLCWFNDIPYNDFSCPVIESHCYVYGKNGSRQSVALPRTYNKNFTCNLDVNEVIDGVKYETGVADFTYDVYIDGKLAANDVCDWAMSHFYGQTYEINDIKCRSGYAFSGGNTSGQLTSNTEVVLTFVQGSGTLDLNGFLDGGESGAIGNYGTADVYINGKLVSAGCWDYCESLPNGTTYEIKNIKAVTGKQYNGVYSGSLKGTIKSGQVTKVFLNFSTSAYQLHFNVNHDNIGLNLYKPTKSSKTINGVNYSYDLSKNTMKLNGSMTVSGGVIDNYEFVPAANSYYKVTAKIVSGSISNGIFVVEAVNGSGGTVGSRIYADIYSNSSKTWYFSSADAQNTKFIKTWLYVADGKTAAFNNAVIQIKIEKVASESASGTEFSPCMRGMHYDESYGTLMTPTRSGYTFNGWYTAASGGTKITSSSKYPAANQTLYAQWTCNHSSTEVRNAKTATCTAEGYTGDTYCKTCGTKTKTGSAIAKTAHSYTSKITKEATHLAEGVKTFTCTCGNSYTEKIAKLTDHTYTAVVTPPTCTEKGYSTYTCTCGDTYVADYVDEKGHLWVTATCSEPKSCIRCDATEGNTLMHQLKLVRKIDPTCTKDGEYIGSCSRCSYTERKTISATGHKWIDATCTAKTTCSKCGETKGDMLDHDYTSVVTLPTCTSRGYTTYTCACGDSYVADETAVLDHNIVTVPGVAATCTETGLTDGRYCSVCDAVVEKQETIDALSHDWTDMTPTYRVCNRCGETDGVLAYDTSVSVGSATGYPGKTVEVYISLDGEVDVKSMVIYDIVYDSDKLTLVNGEWLDESAVIADWNQNAETGAITFSDNTKLSGNVLMLTFEIANDIEDAETEIGCVFKITTQEENGNEKALAVEVIPGFVSVVNAIKGDVNADGFVNSNDAIHLLYHIMLPERYEINQNCDFDGDGYVNSNDAIYLLYHAMLPERYPLT